MTVEQLIAFNLALIAAILSPGPAFLVAVRTTLSAGRSAGLATGVGLALMAAIWTLMALLGLNAVFDLFPWAYALAKTVGAAYLLYLAYRMWKGARDDVESQRYPARRAFRQGFLINLLNPKSALFAAAVLLVIFPPQMSALEKAIVVTNHLLVELTFYTALAFSMNSPAVSRRYLRIKVYTDRSASIVLGALGIRLLATR